MSSQPPAAVAARTAEDVVALVDGVGRRVHGLLDGVRAQVRSAFASGQPGRDELGIDELARDMLRMPDLPLAGAGFVAAPEALRDTAYWLQWWTVGDGPDAVVEPLRVQTDPTADDFRDYTGLDWYAGPRDSGQAHLTGPYVDYLCTDEYTLTFTQPVVRPRAGVEGLPAQRPVDLVGVVGADLYVRVLESQVLPTMARVAQPTVLVGATGRVVTSSGTGWVTGDLVRAVPVASWWRDGVPGDSEWQLLRCASVPLGVLVQRG